MKKMKQERGRNRVYFIWDREEFTEMMTFE